MSPFSLVTQIIAILIAISIHECAHAFAADRLGDKTARYQGRLTLNPLSHLDPLGAILFLFVGFGWAKPVPVNPMNFRHPKRDMAITALAGPLSNLLLAAVVFAVLVGLGSLDTYLAGGDVSGQSAGMIIFLQILRSSLTINLALMAFNLLPVPPLDGSNILRMFIPLRLEERYEDWLRIGPWVLLGLIVLESFLPIRIISTWVFGITDAVLHVFMLIAGGG